MEGRRRSGLLDEGGELDDGGADLTVVHRVEGEVLFRLYVC